MVNDVGESWPLVAALFAMMRSEDALNSERSVGVALFANCSVSRSETERFALFDGPYDAMLKMAINFFPTVGELLQSKFIGTVLYHNITSLKNILLAVDFQSQCLNLSSFDRTAQTNLWRSNIWSYILLLDAIRLNDVIGTIIQVLQLQRIKGNRS